MIAASRPRSRLERAACGEEGDRLYLRAWDALETRHALKRGTALSYEEATIDAARRRAETSERERQRRALEELRARQSATGRGGDVESRVIAYLARCDAGDAGCERNPKAWSAILRTVRGFALDERAALGILMREYAPRSSPAIAEHEMRGMIRRALAARRPDLGYLLERDR